MDEEKRNILAFFAVCILIMVGYPYFLGGNGGNVEISQQQMLNQQTQQDFSTASRTNQSANLGARAGGVNGVGAGASLVSGETPSRTFMVSNDPIKAVEVRINSKKIRGTISTLGMHFNDIQLKKYKENDDKISNVSIFGKPETDQKYYASLEWTTDDPNVLLPNNDTIWEIKEANDPNNSKGDTAISTNSSGQKSKGPKILNEKNPIKVTWDNKNGLSFEREVSIDDNYVVTITDRVQNYGSQAVVLKSSAKIHREFGKDYNNSVAAYEGPLGYFNGKLEEFSYKDISKKGRIETKVNGGWFGITDKYWLVSFIPDQKLEYSAAYSYRPEGNKDLYDVESTSESIILAPSQEISKTYHLFTGAKEIDTLDMYEKKLGIEHFDLAIDFGYLYILTKPMLYCLAFANDTLGSMGLAILLLTLLIKILLLPLAQKSYKSMNRMKYIQPQIQALQKKYASDKVKLGQAVSELYKKEGVNPVGGCLPAMLQAPVLFALYKVIYVSIEMRQAPFYGWITDLSMPDPVWILNLGGLLPYGLPGFLQIGIWPVLMGFSMYLQQKLAPASPDPSQAKMMILMPVMFTFMFAQLPSGLVIYWTFSNILSWGHQYWLMKSDETEQKKIAEQEEDTKKQGAEKIEKENEKSKNTVKDADYNINTKKSQENPGKGRKNDLS